MTPSAPETKNPPSRAADELLAIDCQELYYSFQEGLESALNGATLQLPRGARCLLVGANGAGKSTLLRILAGKRLTKSRDCRILGQDVFMNPPSVSDDEVTRRRGDEATRRRGDDEDTPTDADVIQGVVYLGTEWSSNPVVRSDIVVSDFLDSVGGYRHKARRDRLLNILDVDLDWHMHQISDGERRRVQLCMGLMGEWDVLLLDEVTVDLDVLVRSDLVNFLVEESTVRKATIVYATHIFDGLRAFPTHICHLQLGATPTPLLTWDPADRTTELFDIALEWIRTDRDLRREKERAAGRARGAREETRDAKTFFEKYDYSH
ncbi:CCR4-associated factor 16 [Saitozyma sp. JCM 24511]|nr:CCR4-associated factor 16 [Saitozyma sp. JCM 24511]